MFRRILRVVAFGSCVSIFVLIFTHGLLAETAKPNNQKGLELARMKEILDCPCQCRLTLAYCEKEDAKCSLRPGLLRKLDSLYDEGKRGMDLVRGFVGPVHPVKEELLEARLQNRHAILFFYQEGSRECDEVKAVLEKGSQKWGNRAKISQVDLNKKKNEVIRKEFGIFTTPIVLVMAPNGVVVREIKENITVESIESAFVTPAMAQIMRGLQDRRVVFLTVQGEGWKNVDNVNNTVSRVGDILRNSVRIVHVDPSNGGDKSLLKILKADSDENQPITYVISQSGQIGSRFEGPISRKDLFMAFQKVLSSRSGCGGAGSGLGGNTCK